MFTAWSGVALEQGRGWPLEIRLSPTCVSVTIPTSDILRQDVRAQLWRSARKFWPLTPRVSRSLKVIETDTDRSAIYDFLLVFHGNYGPISYRFRGKGQYLPKFSHSPYIKRPRWWSSPGNFVTAVELGKLE